MGKVFPDDALWFMNMYQYFLALRTPRLDTDEFLLTQNAYSIFEGPNDPGAWADFHTFAPVSPKIMIVLRHECLPTGIEEDEEYEAVKLRQLHQIKSQHLVPASAGSCLEDLPVTKPGNNYSRVVSGKVELLPTKISLDKHVFHFRFVKLQTRHVQKINEILLQQAVGTTAIIYESPMGLRRPLEFYLADESPGFKSVYRSQAGGADDTQFVFQGNGKWSNLREDDWEPYFKLLEKIAQELGSTVRVKYRVINPIKVDLLPNLRPKQQIRYEKLGGTRRSLANDLNQARRIVRLFIKTDSMTRWVTFETKKILHHNREQLISTLPARRVWLFVKHLRTLSKQDFATTIRPFDKSIDGDGVEHAFADAYHIFKYNALSRMIFRAADLNIFLKMSPNSGITRGGALDTDVAQRMQEKLSIMFDKPGRSWNCGIPRVEEMAEYTYQRQPWQLPPGHHEPSLDILYGYLSNDQVKELCMRTMAEATFEGCVGSALGQTELQELKRVLFQDLYRLEFRSRVRD